MSTAYPQDPDGGAPSPGSSGVPDQNRSLGEIVGDIATNMSTLVKQEIDLAKSEMKQEVTKVGKGAGMFGGAALAGFLTLFFVSFALAYLLDNWMAVELAALIVAVLWGIVAAALAMVGRKNLKEANPQLPTTQQTLKEDVEWARTQKG